MKLTRVVTALTIVLVAAGMSACATDTSTDGDVITPISVEANDLQGDTVELIVGQVLNINTGDLATDSYSGETSDDSVAVFTPGTGGTGAEFNPGVKAVGVGETDVTMKNSDGGIQDLNFTVVVTEK
tara:strand:- start:22502 stop:22882 length:381 start_codon:yes stop_codon:yes gene_type:complete